MPDKKPLKIKLSDEDADLVEAFAKAEGISASEYAHDLILEQLRKIEDDEPEKSPH